MHGVDVLQSFRAVGRDHHALAASQTIVFDNVGGTEFVEGGVNKRIARPDRNSDGLCCADLCLGHDVLGEGLRTLNLGRCCRRAEHGEASGAQLIGNARHQGNLRANHNQVRLDLLGQRHRITIRVEGSHGRHAGVARADVNLLDGRILGQGIGQCVLASTAADNKNAHGSPV